MSARHVDPAVWAAAYGAAFVHLYAEEYADTEPGVVMSRRTVALDRVYAPDAIQIADAAVLALGAEEPQQEAAFTPSDAARMALDITNESAALPALDHRRTARLAASLMGLAGAVAKREAERSASAQEREACARNLLRRARKRLIGEPESAVLLAEVDAFLGDP